MAADFDILTSPDLMGYLLSLTLEDGKKMKGTIRPISRQRRCPKCEKAFRHLHKLGYACPDCKTVPTRFYIDLHWKGDRPQICSDKHGQPLDTYQRAQNLLATIQNDIENKTFDPSKYVKADQKKFWASTLLERFLDEKKKTIAPSYVKAYRKHVARHKEFFGGSDVREIRKVDIKDYLARLETEKKNETEKINSKTIKNTLDHFKTFMYWLKNELEIIDTVPPFPHVEVAEYQYTWFSAEDQIKILGLIEEGARPIIAFLMLHGCRPGEARALKVKHVDIVKRTIRISSTFSNTEIREKRKGRGARALEIPIHPEMLEHFEERVKNHPEAFIFVNPHTGSHYTSSSFRRVWLKARTNAKLPEKIRCYDATRHSLGSQLANAGESIFMISKILGHSSVKMTEKYTHKNIEALRATLSKLSLHKKEADVVKLPDREQTVNKQNS